MRTQASGRLKLLLLGGIYVLNDPFDREEIYSVEGDEWKLSHNSFPLFLSDSRSIQFGESFLVVGGYDKREFSTVLSLPFTR